jgi:hypothetical protein
MIQALKKFSVEKERVTTKELHRGKCAAGSNGARLAGEGGFERNLSAFRSDFR